MSSGEISRAQPLRTGAHFMALDAPAAAGLAGKALPGKPAFIDLPLPWPKKRSGLDNLPSDLPVAADANAASSSRLAADADAVRFHDWPPRPAPRHGDPAARQALALGQAAQKMAQAHAQGVAVPHLSFMRRLQQVAQVPLAAFDLLLACVATVATLGLVGPAAAMAADKLKQAVKAVGTPPAPAPPPPSTSALPLQAVPAQPSASGGVIDDQPVQKATAALREARESMEAVKRKTGIDFARRGFVSRAIGVGVGLVGLGLAIAATVASGGMAAPALVLTVVLLRQTLANAHCAWRHLQRQSAGLPGLPMGANALANAMYDYQMSRAGMTPEQARLSATRSAAAASLATVGTVMAFGAVFVLAVPLVEKCVRAFCSMAQRAVLPPADFALSETQKLRLERLQREADLRATAALEALLRKQDELRDSLGDVAAAATVRDEQPVFDSLVEELRRWPAQRPQLDAMVERLEAALQTSGLRSAQDPDEARRRRQAQQLGTAVFSASTLTLSTSLLVSLAG